MQLIQEYVKDNEEHHEREYSYNFVIIGNPRKNALVFGGFYTVTRFDKTYDVMIVKKLPKGFRATKERDFDED